MARSRRTRKRLRWLSPVEREQVVARLRGGERGVGVAAAFGVSLRTVDRVRNEAALVGRRRAHSEFRLSFVERVEIGVRVGAGESDSEIARALGRHRSTIGREINRCGGRKAYRPIRAEQRAQGGARRPKECKLARCGRLLAEVEAGLERALVAGADIGQTESAIIPMMRSCGSARRRSTARCM